MAGFSFFNRDPGEKLFGARLINNQAVGLEDNLALYQAEDTNDQRAIYTDYQIRCRYEKRPAQIHASDCVGVGVPRRFSCFCTDGKPNVVIHCGLDSKTRLSQASDSQPKFSRPELGIVR